MTKDRQKAQPVTTRRLAQVTCARCSGRVTVRPGMTAQEALGGHYVDAHGVGK